MTQELSKKWADKLTASGIPCTTYKRSPAAGGGFFISAGVSGKQMKIWVGKDATLNVKTNKRKKQAIINVEEPPRTVRRVERVVSAYQADTPNKQSFKDSFIRKAKRWNSLPVIPGSRLSAKVDQKSLDYAWDNRKTKNTYGDDMVQYNDHIVRVHLSRKSRKTTMNLLVGQDEERLFICALPEEADTITEAHDLLRPEGLSDDAVRQGEFFFDKVTSAKMLKRIEKLGTNIKSGRTTRFGDVSYQTPSSRKVTLDCALEPNSSHRAAVGVKIDKDTYVSGVVHDSRSGRHAPLLLNGWCKVVRNREIVVKQLEGRSQTWD